MFEQLIIIGNLGADPEMRYTPSGVPVTNFDVAVSRRWKDWEGNPQEETKWFRVTAWRKLAEVCNEYLHKGRRVMVIGTVSAEAWTGRDGEPRAKLAVTAETVRFLDGNSAHVGTGQGAAPPPPEPGDPNAGWEEDDGLPF